MEGRQELRAAFPGPLPTSLSLCLICSLRQLGRLSLVLAPAISHLCVTLKMCAEPGLGGELGRQLGVAWETAEEKRCSPRLLAAEGPTAGGPTGASPEATAPCALRWGLPDSGEADRKAGMWGWGCVEFLTQ